MAHINVLSKEVSELIAAGEVIDRPSSIVKELLENSIDAGANVITVEIKNGGRTYLRITDNGSGISQQDVKKAFLRHATSKISSKDDLDSIFTLGFRGEALASISAISKVDVLTKLVDEPYGTHYVIEGTEEKICESSGCPDGTTFVVRDVFYNVPARLKFLKKDTTEANYVANLVSKLALSHPEISFKFIRDNKTDILTAGDGKLYSSIYSIFGRDFASSLIPVDYTWEDVHVSGFTVSPVLAKPNRKFQNFFVNGRFVKSKTCCDALEESYRNTIMVGRFPACVLNINLPPNTIDVNVHPTKIEVRFSNDKLIHEAIYFAVKDALLKKDKPQEIKFEKKTFFTDKELYDFPDKPQGEQLKMNLSSQKVAGEINSNCNCIIDRVKVDNVSKEKVIVKTVVPPVVASPDKKVTGESDLFVSSLSPNNSKIREIPNVVDVSNETVEVENAQNVDSIKIVEEKKLELPEEIVEEIAEFKYISNQSFEKQNLIIEEHEEEEVIKPVVVGELFKTYIVAQAGEDMLLIDKHAAHERYIFEKIKGESENLDTQMYLEPIIVLLSYDEYDVLIANFEKVNRLGFAIEADLAPSVAVKGVPILLGDDNPTEIVTELAKNFLECKQNPQIEIFDELYHSIACKAAIKANDNSSKIELQALVNLIYNRDDIKYCPHGRPIMIKLSKKDIEKQFKRII